MTPEQVWMLVSLLIGAVGLFVGWAVGFRRGHDRATRIWDKLREYDDRSGPGGGGSG